MLKLENDDLRGILIRLGIIAGIIVLIYFAISFGMKTVNSSLGIDENRVKMVNLGPDMAQRFVQEMKKMAGKTEER